MIEPRKYRFSTFYHYHSRTHRGTATFSRLRGGGLMVSDRHRQKGIGAFSRRNSAISFGRNIAQGVEFDLVVTLLTREKSAPYQPVLIICKRANPVATLAVFDMNLCIVQYILEFKSC